MGLPLFDLISGILKGIGGLLAELRKSREAILLYRLVGSTVLTFIVTAAAGYGLGLDRQQALRLAALASAVVAISSPLSERLDVRVPEPVASHLADLLGPWKIVSPPPPVPAFSGGIFLFPKSKIRYEMPLPNPVRINSISGRLGERSANFVLSVGGSNWTLSGERRNWTIRLDRVFRERFEIEIGAGSGIVHLLSLQTDPPILPKEVAEFIYPENAPRSPFPANPK